MTRLKRTWIDVAPDLALTGPFCHVDDSSSPVYVHTAIGAAAELSSHGRSIINMNRRQLLVGQPGRVLPSQVWYSSSPSAVMLTILFSRLWTAFRPQCSPLARSCHTL